jgi:dTMP kinase
MKKNLFIAFEGIDGSGKSTQVKLLAQKLIAEGHKVYTTFEPTDSSIGSIIRKILKHEAEADERTIAALFAADRLNHLLNKDNGILKKLEEGYTVITDRYYFSSYAYHSVHVPMDWVITTNSLSADILRPNITLFIDIDPEISIQRLQNNRGSIELYETLDNLKKVKANYEKAFSLVKDKENIISINGNKPTDDIAADIWLAVFSVCN